MRALFAISALVVLALAVSAKPAHLPATPKKSAHKPAKPTKPNPRLGVHPKPRKAAAPVPPTFPLTYTAQATITLPYADITEPMTYYYDQANGFQRTDYYGGLDSYIMSVAANMTWQVMPMGYNTTGCLYIPGAVQLQSVFPDLSQFTFRDTEACPGDQYAGQQCNAFTYVNVVGNKTNTYTMYATAQGAANAQPVRYVMFGYDSLFGSHYDEYIVDYGNVDTTPIDPEVFAKPSAFPCTPFPGTPGQFRMGHPANDFNPIPHKKNGDEHVVAAFDAWAKKHGKTYESELHAAKRRQIFHNNLRYINSINRQAKSYKVAINHMADLTRQERNARLGTRAPPAMGNGAGKYHELVYKNKADLPAAVDWRTTGAVSAVKDQGVCGSCWSFGSHETIEGSYFMKTGKSIRLSSQALVDCSWITGNTGCDGGNDFLAYQWLLNYNGGKIPTEDSYPYLMANGVCHADRAQTGAVITGYVNVTSGSEQALMDAIATVGPISISIDASHDSLSFYSSGVYYEPACQNGVNDLDHTVLAVGYGSENGQSYWIVKNSWSTHWGWNGYVYMSQQNNNCGVATAPTYVTM